MALNVCNDLEHDPRHQAGLRRLNQQRQISVVLDQACQDVLTPLNNLFMATGKIHLGLYLTGLLSAAMLVPAKQEYSEAAARKALALWA